MTVIDNQFLELKRKANTGCLGSALELAECYAEGDLGIKRNKTRFLEMCFEMLDRIDELRASEFSTAIIYYEIMYTYLERSELFLAEYYHYFLMWEVMYDCPSGDMEPFFEKYQVYEIAEFINLDIADIIADIKALQKEYDTATYKIIDVNHFFTI